jgi:asparagine synthetase B (glutamine-hydrolysing)
MTALDLQAGVEALSSAPPSFLARYRGDSGLELTQGPDETATLARDEACAVVFAGELLDRERLGEPDSSEPRSDAGAILAAYRARGEEIFGDLRGVFALAIHDRETNTLLFARDQLGHHPLFFSPGRGGVHLSDSIVRLVRQPDVSNAIDRVVVAEMLIHRARSSDETGFEAVRRARSGWLYRLDASGLSARRYWFPVEPDGATEWARDDELPQFEGLMESAVRRSIEPGATGIFLSGGLDSVTVATYAADLLAAGGEAPPCALSIMFPEFDETAVQTTVAQTLGLPHTLVPFEEASGADGLVLSAVRTSGTWPQPLVNLWQPAYAHLALLAKEMGIRRVLTGAGGDEWLQVSPQWGFSRLRRLQVREMHHLYRTYLQSYNLKRGPLLKNLLWRYGIRHTLRGAALKSLDVATPRLGSALKTRRFRNTRPEWLAPESALAAEVEGRAGSVRAIEAPEIQFAGDNFPFLENPIGAMEREEAFERGRRMGVETYMPFWDPDLDNFLARVPPHLMNKGYWSKGLVRTKLAERFPNAGFATQRKVLSTTLSTRLMYEQTPTAWAKMGGVPALSGAGIVDEKALQSDVERRLKLIERPEGSSSEQTLARSIAAHGIWTVLNVESWLRQWV